MTDKEVIWYANQLTESQARFAKMIINDLRKFSFGGDYNKNYRDHLEKKYNYYAKKGE